MSNNNNNGETEKQFDKRTKGAQRLFEAVKGAASFPSGSEYAKPYMTIINRLIRDGVDVNIESFYEEQTPLNYAIQADNPKIVELLIQAGARVDTNDITSAISPKIKAIIQIAPAIVKKAKNQTVRKIYGNMTNQASDPGTGPANIIRRFLGAQPRKGAQGAFSHNKRIYSRKRRL